MKKSEIKSFAEIKIFYPPCHSRDIICHSREGGNLLSEQINFFDKIYFEEKNNSNWWIEIKKIWKIKFPTNAENTCFLAAKEMQKFFAKKNNWKKPKSISITIEKNIPLNSWLWWAFSNGFSTLNFLNNFWEIDLSEWEILSLSNSLLDYSLCLEWQCEKKFFDKKFFILIPKYILIEKKFFEKILNNSKNFSEAQKKIKEIFPDLKKFIKIFLENWAEFSDISWKWSAVFWIFPQKISEEKIKNLEKIFKNFWDLKIF